MGKAEQEAVPAPGQRRFGIDLDRASEARLGPFEVPLEPELDERPRGVKLGQVGLELGGAVDGGLRLGECDAWIESVETQAAILAVINFKMD